MNALATSIPGRSLALLLTIGVATLGCRPGRSLRPSSGMPEYQLAGVIPVPGGSVNAAGGNLMIERVDLSMDTILGTLEIRASYNATSGAWLWNFQVAYDGTTFLDPTGARHDVGALPDGSPIAGTVYVKADGNTIETKGGLAFHFDGNGALTHMAWKTAAYPRLEYTRTGSTLDIAQCAAAPACTDVYSIALNAEGNPTFLTDARTGRAADFQYDGLGRLVVARDALDVDKSWPGLRYEYSLGGTLLTAVTNSQDERIEYVYQGNRRILDVIQIGEGNPVHRFEYTAKASDGLYTTIHTNPLGAETRYRVDAERRLHQVELAETGELTTVAWLGKRPSSMRLPNDSTTTFIYVDDSLATLTQPSGNVVSFTYEPGGLNRENPFAPAVLRMEDNIGVIEERAYDGQGRVVAVSNGEGDGIGSTYTNATLASFTNPQGAVFDFPLHGIHGRWIQMQGDATDKRAIDLVGNVQVPSVQRQVGGVLSRSHDADRNIASVHVAAISQDAVTSQGIITIERRSDGAPISIWRPGGADHEFDYDALGRLIERRERVDGTWQATAFEYDAAGNRTARTRPNGMRQEFDYDGYGRRVRHRAFRGGILEGEAISTYSDGLLASFTDTLRNTTEFYGYDGAGRMTAIVFGFGETGALEYDLRSRLTAEELSLPGQGSIRRLEYAYDLADRPTRVTAGGDEVLVEWTYQHGQVVQVDYGNGLSRAFSHDFVTGQLTSATTTGASGSVVASTTVTHTAEVDPTSQEFTSQTTTALAATEERYRMGLGGSFATPEQYVGRRVFAWNDGDGASKSYDYDELSNQLSNAAGDSFVYNPEGSRLLAATLVHEAVSITYAFDEAGFATSRNGVPITWTATGRMASFGSTAMDWDMRGRPISRTVGPVSRDFLYFGGRVASDPGTGTLQSLDLGPVSIPFGSESRTYRHFDFRGNVSFVSDEGGNIVTHYRYSAYGLDAVFGTDSDPVRFAGRAEIGELMLLGARIYDPAVGRFLSPDPVFQVLNQATYTFGNPVWYWDPDGAQPSAATGPSNAQFRSYYMTVVKAMGVVTAVGVVTGNYPLAAAATTTGAVVYAIAAIDGTIAEFGGLNGFLGAFGFADLYPGACKRRCGAPKQIKELEIKVDPEGAGSGEPGESGGGGPPPPSPPPLGACAPNTGGVIGDLAGALWVLGPLQILLGALVLRDRRRRRMGR